jgi:hypothetical protein
MIRHIDFLSGILFVVLGLAFGIGALSYRFGTPSNMGAGFLPACLAGILMVLGVVILVKAIIEPGELIEPGAFRPIGVVIGTLVLFALVLRPLGFAATAFLSSFAVTYAGASVPLVQRLLPATALAVVATVVFVVLLGLPIPVWPRFLS